MIGRMQEVEIEEREKYTTGDADCYPTDETENMIYIIPDEYTMVYDVFEGINFPIFRLIQPWEMESRKEPKVHFEIGINRSLGICISRRLMPSFSGYLPQRHRERAKGK